MPNRMCTQNGSKYAWCVIVFIVVDAKRTGIFVQMAEKMHCLRSVIGHLNREYLCPVYDAGIDKRSAHAHTIERAHGSQQKPTNDQRQQKAEITKYHDIK